MGVSQRQRVCSSSKEYRAASPVNQDRMRIALEAWDDYIKNPQPMNWALSKPALDHHSKNLGQSTTVQSNSLLLSLPAEIRLRIWELSITASAESLHITTQTDYDDLLPLPSNPSYIDHCRLVSSDACIKSIQEYHWSIHSPFLPYHEHLLSRSTMITALSLSLACRQIYRDIVLGSLLYKYNTIYLTNHPTYINSTIFPPSSAALDVITSIHFTLYIQPSRYPEDQYDALNQLLVFPALKHFTLECIYRDDSSKWDAELGQWYVSGKMLRELRHQPVFEKLKGLKTFELRLEVLRRYNYCHCKGGCPWGMGIGLKWRGDRSRRRWVDFLNERIAKSPEGNGDKNAIRSMTELEIDCTLLRHRGYKHAENWIRDMVMRPKETPVLWWR